MPRRLLPLAALVLAVSLSAGCAEGGAPAARVSDTIEITNEQLMDEVADWAASPALLEQVGVATAEGAAPESYSTNLVDVVLTNRIRFDLHREQFDALGLTVDPASTDTLEGQLAGVLDEVSPAFGERLVGDLARLSVVSSAMGDQYTPWFTEAGAEVEVSSRYGTWDQQAATVVPPEGPRSAPSQLLEP